MTATPSPLPPVDDLAAALMAGDPAYGAPSRVDLPDGRWLTMAVEPDDMEVDWAALGGIEPFPDDAYLRDVAGDLIAEVLA